MFTNDHTLEIPRLVLDRRFADIFSFTDALPGLELEFRQLDAGPLRARATIVEGRRSAALQCELDRDFHQIGSVPTGLLAFGLPDREIRWCGVDAGAGDILNLNLQAGFEGASGGGFSGQVFLFEEDLLRELSCDLGLGLDLQPTVRHSAWRAGAAVVAGLKRRLAGTLEKARVSGSLNEGAAEFFNHTAAEAMVRLLSRSATVETPSNPISRRRALKVALELLNDQERLPLRVSDLCRASGASGPTLHRAFQDELGVSPKQYIQSRSLSGARRDLLCCCWCSCCA